MYLCYERWTEAMSEAVEGCVNKGYGWVYLLLVEVARSRCWCCCSYGGCDFGFWRYGGFGRVVMEGEGRWCERSRVRWVWWIWGNEDDFWGRRSWKTVVNGGYCMEARWFFRCGGSCQLCATDLSYDVKWRRRRNLFWIFWKWGEKSASVAWGFLPWKLSPQFFSQWVIYVVY